MSEWTHISGVIRYDSWSKNTFPKPLNSVENVNIELNTIYSVFSAGVPQGSEGPLEVNGIVTDRGPTLVITGDLRDFGIDDIPSIIKWLNESYKIVRKEFDNSSANIRLTTLRDASIRLDNENEKEDFYISFNFETEQFECYIWKSFSYVEKQKKEVE